MPIPDRNSMRRRDRLNSFVERAIRNLKLVSRPLGKRMVVNTSPQGAGKRPRFRGEPNRVTVARPVKRFDPKTISANPETRTVARNISKGEHSIYV